MTGKPGSLAEAIANATDGTGTRCIAATRINQLDKDARDEYDEWESTRVPHVSASIEDMAYAIRKVTGGNLSASSLTKHVNRKCTCYGW